MDGIGSRSLNVNFLNLDVLGRVQDAIAGAVMPGHPPAPPLPSDPIMQYRYLHGRRQTISDATRQRPLLRLWDKNMHFIGAIGQERSVRVEEIMADSGGGNCVIRHDNWLSSFILHDRRIEEDLHFLPWIPFPANRIGAPAGEAKSSASTPNAAPTAYTPSNSKWSPTENTSNTS